MSNDLRCAMCGATAKLDAVGDHSFCRGRACAEMWHARAAFAQAMRTGTIPQADVYPDAPGTWCQLDCWFCGKTTAEVAVMVEAERAPVPRICDECLVQAVALLPDAVKDKVFDELTRPLRVAVSQIIAARNG